MNASVSRHVLVASFVDGSHEIVDLSGPDASYSAALAAMVRLLNTADRSSDLFAFVVVMPNGAVSTYSGSEAADELRHFHRSAYAGAAVAYLDQFYRKCRMVRPIDAGDFATLLDPATREDFLSFYASHLPAGNSAITLIDGARFCLGLIK